MRRRDIVLAALLLLTLAVAVFSLGGAMRWGQAAVAFAAAIAIVPTLWSRSAPQKISPLLALIGAAIALTAIQIVPLPSGLVALLNSTGEALRVDGAALANVDPPTTLSLDLPATLRALAFFVILFGVALVALRLSAQERGRYLVIATVVVIIGVAAVVTALHELVGATSLYGLYTPRAKPSVLGPLLNENHLGGLMAFGAVAGLGLLLYERQQTWLRVMWLVIVLGCSAACVATQSRGAAIALGAGLVVTIGILAGQRLGKPVSQRRRTRLLTNALPLGVVAASMIVIAIYASAGGLQRELDRTSLSKIETPQSKFAAWRSATALIGESPWIGVGRGAMESSFTRVHPASGQVTFSHVENEYLQTVIDFGIPGALVLVICVAWVMRWALRRWRSGPLAAASIGAVVCIGIHSNVDFGIELLGLAVPVVAVIATLVYVPLKEASRPLLLRMRALRGGAIAAMLGAGAMLFADGTRSLDEDRELVEDAGAAVTLEQLQEVIERHPLSYYPFAVAAQQLARAGDPRAIRFLNHALLLHPTHPGLHHVAARILRRSGYQDQAIIEYAAALRTAPDRQRLLAEVLAAFPDDKAVEVLPDDSRELDVMVKMLRALDRPTLATRWLMRILTTRRSPRACELLFDISLDGADLDAAQVAGQRCLDMMPDRHTRLSLARLLYKNKRYADLLPLLGDVEDWQGRIDDTVTAWLLVCDARIELGDLDQAKRCLRRLDVSGDVRPEREPELKARFEKIEKRREAAVSPAEPAKL